MKINLENEKRVCTFAPRFRIEVDKKEEKRVLAAVRKKVEKFKFEAR